MDGTLLDRSIAACPGDPIATLTVRPIVLAGRNGELADLDLIRARRAKIEELMVASLHFSIHTEHVSAISIDWESQRLPGIEAVTAITVEGRELPGGDWRIRALRAVCAEAVMAICDG
jgi:hypothetical protein